MQAYDVDSFTWCKSSYSSANANCVEIARETEVVGVRDSKVPQSGHLTLPAEGWRELLRAI